MLRFLAISKGIVKRTSDDKSYRKDKIDVDMFSSHRESLSGFAALTGLFFLFHQCHFFMIDKVTGFDPIEIDTRRYQCTIFIPAMGGFWGSWLFCGCP